MIESLLGSQSLPEIADCSSKALIVPHAGLIYSGPVAASAYQTAKNLSEKIKRVILIGPSHQVAFQGIATPTVKFFRTPLGDIELDTPALEQLVADGIAHPLDLAHDREHCLEVQLPFLQRLLGQFKLVPLVVGDASKEIVAQLLSKLWGQEETLVVISSDLSHYHTYAQAQKIDSATAMKIVNLIPDLEGDDACGCRCINGLIEYARNNDLKIEKIRVNNSGDTAGDKDKVVGYGAFNICTPGANTYSLAQRQRLLQVAREAILQPLISQDNYHIDLKKFPPSLTENRASFVTLQLHDKLRGCIGSLAPHRALIVDVAYNAQSAAFKDPRFTPLTIDDFHDTVIHLSILSQPQLLVCPDRNSLLQLLKPGRDGIIIEENGKSATYLPSVWEQLPDPEVFITELRRKAGLEPAGWSTTTRVLHYTTEEFS